MDHDCCNCENEVVFKSHSSREYDEVRSVKVMQKGKHSENLVDLKSILVSEKLV